MMTAADWIGFAGVGTLLLAYLLNLLNRISPNGLVYVGLNVVGGALAGLASVLIHYTPFIILETAWTLVSLVTLGNLLIRRNPANHNKS